MTSKCRKEPGSTSFSFSASFPTSLTTVHSQSLKPVLFLYPCSKSESSLQFCLEHFFYFTIHYTFDLGHFLHAHSFLYSFTSDITFSSKLPSSPLLLSKYMPSASHAWLLLPDSKLSLPHQPPDLPIKGVCRNINIKIPSPCFIPISGFPLIIG